jgi:hypothetical protein
MSHSHRSYGSCHLSRPSYLDRTFYDPVIFLGVEEMSIWNGQIMESFFRGRTPYPYLFSTFPDLLATKNSGEAMLISDEVCQSYLVS